VQDVNGEPAQQPRCNERQPRVDLQCQSEVRALAIEVKVQPPSVEFKWGAERRSSNGVQRQSGGRSNVKGVNEGEGYYGIQLFYKRVKW